MTKKDYELIADSLKESWLDVKQFGLKASDSEIDEIVTHICNNLSLALQDNPKFNQDKFLTDCGVTTGAVYGSYGDLPNYGKRIG